MYRDQYEFPKIFSELSYRDHVIIDYNGEREVKSAPSKFADNLKVGPVRA